MHSIETTFVIKRQNLSRVSALGCRELEGGTVWKYISESKLTIWYCTTYYVYGENCLWDVTVCSFVSRNKYFRRIYCLGLLGRSLKKDQMHIKQNKLLYEVICERN